MTVFRSTTSANAPRAHRDTTRGPRATATRRRTSSLAAAALPLAVMLSAPAHAYVGPGAGLGVIGTLFGIGAAIVLAMFGLFWYPLKRAFGRKAVAGDASATGVPTPGETGEAATPARTDTGSERAARRDDAAG